MKLIGLAGKKGAGKDSVANIFVKKEGFKKIAFADPLKEMLTKVFRVPSEYFHDEKLKEGSLPDYITIDYHHLDKLRDYVENEWNFPIDYETREKIENRFYGKEIKTPRELMQIIGTNLLRNCIRDDMFVNLFFTRIKDFGSNIIVSDVRLSNEREALKKAGGHVILIKRGEDSKDQHISENDLGTESDYEVVINNNDITLQQLESEILMWYAIKAKYK